MPRSGASCSCGARACDDILPGGNHGSDQRWAPRHRRLRGELTSGGIVHNNLVSMPGIAGTVFRPIVLRNATNITLTDRRHLPQCPRGSAVSTSDMSARSEARSLPPLCGLRPGREVIRYGSGGFTADIGGDRRAHSRDASSVVER